MTLEEYDALKMFELDDIKIRKKNGFNTIYKPKGKTNE